MKEQIKSQIEKWLDEKGYELRVRNYNQIHISEEQIIDDLATRLDKANGKELHAGHDKPKKRTCLYCGKRFQSEGIWNRICRECKQNPLTA